MKPNFALSLSFEGIQLLHRAAGGWRVVGEVALDAADLAADMAVLRKAADALEPGGLRTKVLIPDAQIKYLTIPTPDMSDEDRVAAAKAALDGATPYAVNDLAFDISADGPRTHVATVARETMAEAEAFAVEHRFNPVSFAAVPGMQPYVGEPYFGPTDSAADYLEDGETVEPDGIAMVIVGDAPVPTGEVAPETAKPVAAGPDSALADAKAADAGVTDTSHTRTPENLEPQEKHGSTASPRTEQPQAAAPTPAKANPAPAQSNEADADGAVTAGPAAATPIPPKPDMSFPAKAGNEPTPASDSHQASKGGVAIHRGPAEAEKAPTEKRAAEKPAPVRPTVHAARTPVPMPAVPTVKAPADTAKNIPSMPPLRAARAAPDKTAENQPNAVPAGFASRRKPVASAPAAAGTRREPTVSAPPSVQDAGTSAAVIKPDSSSLKPMPETPDAANAKPAAARGGFLSRRKKSAAPAPAAGAIPAAAAPQPGGRAGSEAERMTIFGARKANVGGKPRFLGLILTTALLVFLAGVAAWASVFLDDGLSLSRLFGPRNEPETVAAPVIPAPAQEPEAPAAEDPVRTAALESGLTEEDGAVLDALREPVPEAVQAELSEAELDAKYAATGIWTRAPVVPPAPADQVDIEDLYLTGIDPISTAADAIALPALDSLLTDAAFDGGVNPAAAGTRFALDERGLVTPTPAGTLNPDGVVIYQGRPDISPPAALLARFNPAAEDAPEQLSVLATTRPAMRPRDLVESAERARFDGLTRDELADYRPSLRPASVQEQAVAAAAPAVTPEDTAEAVAAALAAPTVPNTFQNVTKFAVAASPRPDTRPRNFDRIVRRAERSRPQQETRVASVAAVAPRSVAPKIPSKTSVAKQATVKNALNLRKVNLIGVYGKPSNRRALVRLGNGRYQKVVVGDRIDGGRVSAIGDGELRYTKKGRSLILKMPSS